jgi:hypothetical protein
MDRCFGDRQSTLASTQNAANEVRRLRTTFGLVIGQHPVWCEGMGHCKTANGARSSG